jgi:hypothetical protein
MDSSLLPTPAATRSVPRRWLLPGAVILGFVAYGLFLARYMGAYGGGSDSSGYLNNARLLAHATTHMPQRVLPNVDGEKIDPYVFVPLGFRPMPAKRMAPTYPIGLPLAIAATAQVTGWKAAPHFTMGLSALLGLALTALLGRAAGLPWTWSWFGTLILGSSALYTFLSLQLMSDIPATALAVATILSAWRSRQQTSWALLAGVAMAAGVLTRPSNLVLMLPVAICLGLNWRRWIFLGLGGVPGAAAQCLYNWHAYGHPLESGYGGYGGLFSFEIIPVTLRNYVQWLPVLLTPVGLLAVALPWTHRRQRFAWVLLSWIAAVCAFYASYYHTHETWWYLRFLLPAFPAFIVGGLWVLHAWWLRRESWWIKRPGISPLFAATAVLLIVVNGAAWNFQLHAYSIGEGESVYHESVDWAREHLPANATLAVMQGSGALVYYSDFTFVRWDIISAEQAALITRASLAAGRPVFALLWPFEVKDALERHMPGHWTQVGAVRHVTIWKWDPPAP